MVGNFFAFGVDSQDSRAVFSKKRPVGQPDCEKFGRAGDYKEQLFFQNLCYGFWHARKS